MSIRGSLTSLLLRGKTWKRRIEAQLARTAAVLHMLARLGTVGARLATETTMRAQSFAARLAEASLAFVDPSIRVLLGRRAHVVMLLAVPRDVAASAKLGGTPPLPVVEAVLSGAVREAWLMEHNGRGWRWTLVPAVIEAIRNDPVGALAWLETSEPDRSRAPSGSEISYFDRLDAILADLDRLDFYAHGSAVADGTPNPPFDAPADLPPRAPAEPQCKTALFLHNNYYHFNCLAAGLRARGWDAVTVSCESPESPQRQFYHGEDLNLHDPDPATLRRRIRDFFKTVPERYSAIHFYGQGQPSFFFDHYENTESPRAIPWDFLELRRHRVIIGYMPSGCLDGGLQSSIRTLTGDLCSHCVWERRPDVCSDARNLAWNHKLQRLCDWVGIELDHATPERIGPRTVYGPVVTTLDPNRWRPDLEVPEDMRIERRPGEIIVYHAVGNYEMRRAHGRDIKGTGAVLTAIDRLKSEGWPVRLVFARDIPSTKVRFLQVQADIVVDQLNYGRYGANAREAIMLGKPTICRLRDRQVTMQPLLRAIRGVPMRNASEDTVYEVLKDLIRDEPGRLRLGQAARAFAVAWHGQDACAARYEMVIDRIRAGLPPETEELYPTLSPPGLSDVS